ncbi:uncharacterized protein LOC143280552 isoform X2 [Babylonia areolata]|uniref:uncharacterized protein LOC143280552 isoform X2 n=1 Tax=Babylonia areolata TaxID=304850 RepID=UPI003FD5C729
MLRNISLLFSACLQTLCLVQALSKQDGESQGTTVPKPFVISLQQSCDDWVIFAWNSSTDGFPALFGPSHCMSCEITYMDQHSQVAQLGMAAIHPDVRTIQLSTLNRSTNYTASMTCNETLTSNTIDFVTGYPCSEEEVKEHAEKLRRRQQWRKNNDDDKEVSQHPVKVTTASDDFSMMDMALGVFFAMFGVMIIGLFAYYVWKKHRHRQRIQRIFGQSHSEPFLALHTPSDQPTPSL